MRQSLYEVLIPHALEAFGDQAEADARIEAVIDLIMEAIEKCGAPDTTLNVPVRFSTTEPETILILIIRPDGDIAVSRNPTPADMRLLDKARLVRESAEATDAELARLQREATR